MSVLLGGAKEMKKTLYSLLETTTTTTDSVVGCSAQLFDGVTAKVITDFIEGTQTFVATANVDVKEDLDKVTQHRWPKKLVINSVADGSSFRIDLKLSGILNEAERHHLVQGVEGLSDLNSKLGSLVNQSLAPRLVLSKRLEKNVESKQRLATSILLQDWPADKPVSPEPASDPPKKQMTPAEKAEEEALQAQKKAIEAEKLLQERRDAFVKLVGPTIIQDLSTTLVTNTINDILKDTNPLLLPLILSDIVQVSDSNGSGKLSALVALGTLCQSDVNPDQILLDAYFVPPATEDFTFSFTGDAKVLPGGKVPPLKVNGLEVAFDSASNTWTASRLVGGQPNLLQCDLPIAKIYWSTPKSMPSAWASGVLLDSKKIQYAERLCRAISRVTTVCQTMKLGGAELEYINLPASATDKQLSIDLNSPTVQSLGQLARYTELKRSIGTNSNEDHTFIEFSKWLSQTSSASATTIASKVVACTGWNEAVINSILQAKYAGYKDSDLVVALRSLDAMLELKTIVTLYGRLGSSSTNFASKPLISNLFQNTQPRARLYGDAKYTEAAKTLQSSLTPSQKDEADEALAENQRRALVSYLLQQTYFKDDLDIYDADGLFDYFLIDVQMGPQIRTSRIKQAISVVQLFIQRCLLGMEEGVSKAALPREKWQWMQQYTLWEAHRKIFLYPENWIDPTLRDDKSPLFNQFEASLMQKDLSIKTFSQAVQTYVYGLNEISSLDIVAYLHEPQVDSDIYHFFARSRAAPYIFYYRTMTIYTLGHEIFWQPWSKIEMDIPSVETEWYGKRLDETGAYILPVLIGGRLYLFMPSISIKSIANDDRTISAANDVRTDKSKTNIAVMGELAKLPVSAPRPDRIWEVTMGWTELVNGTWSQKRVSSGSLSAPSAASSSQFRFDPDFDQNKVTLNVSFSTSGGKVRTAVGSFIFGDDQISAVAATPTTKATPFPTEFQKVVSKNFDPSSLLAPNTSTYSRNTALIWTPRKLADKSDMAWTLSKSRQQVTGLVITVKESDGTKVSYFNIPKVPLYKPDPKMPWDKNELASNMDLATMDHTFSHELMQATSDHIDPLQSLYNYMANLPYDSLRESYGAGSNSAWYHELGKPTAIYNWEIGLHAALLAVDRFCSTQQFEEALQVARLVFDPTISQELKVENGSKTGETYQSCWRFPPFQDMARKMQRDGESSFDPLNLDQLQKELRLAISERRGYPALVHAAARGRPVAYMKWIMMKSAEILILMGDVHFRTGRLEALPLATQRYIEATHVLGREPPVIPDLAKRKKRAKTFAQLRESDVSFDLVSIEIGLPFARQLQRGAATEADADKKREKLRCFLRTDYFCTPLNPRFKQMRSLVHERLYNLRNSLDINGKPIVYALREPPIDPRRLMELSNQGNSLSDGMAMAMGEQDGPLPHYRFEILIRNALELCGELRALGERLITAIEKKEVEAFSLIQARNNTSIQQMMYDIKKIQLEEATMTIEALLITRSSHEAQLNYYLKLIGEPDTKIPKPKDTWVDIQQSIEEPTKDDLKMTSYEKSEMDLAFAASITSTIAAGIDGIVAPLAAIPQIEAYAAPLGVGASTSMGGSQLSSALAFGSTALKMTSTILQEQGNRAGRKAQLTRQLQERRLQANIHGREIKSIDKQVEIQNIRVRATNNEIEQAKVQWDQSVQAEQWYRSKYTSEQLYGWMEKSIRNQYFQAYTLALTMARRAEAAFAFDEGRNIRILRPEGYWDAARGGLFAADHLYLDLKRLETAQIDSGRSDFEITKTISLREIDPMALFRLRATGTCEFTLGELLYDMDFPGHYMRRIKSVAMTIPAVIGPYSGVSATLTLLSHKYRVSRSASTGKDYLASQGAGNESFRFDRLPSTSIAISSGSSDSGVFELTFSGPTYMPFEGAGAISTWRLELPTTIRKFDYETISDVLLHMRYTAYNGGAVLKAAANDAVLQTAKAAEKKSQGFWALWDLKNDFSSSWCGFSSKLLAAKKSGTDDRIDAELGDIKARLPFFARQATIQVRSISFISLDQQLINNMKLSVLDAEDEVDLSTMGLYSMRTMKTGVSKLDGWAVSATRQALVPEANSVSNVYMIIQYAFGGKKSG